MLDMKPSAVGLTRRRGLAGCKMKLNATGEFTLQCPWHFCAWTYTEPFKENIYLLESNLEDLSGSSMFYFTLSFGTVTKHCFYLPSNLLGTRCLFCSFNYPFTSIVAFLFK